MEKEPDLTNVEVVEEEFKPVHGVTSNVIRFPKRKDVQPYSIGHVLMIDIERKVLQSNNFRIPLINRDGVWFILESSKNGYHIHNPAIKSLQECKEVMEELQDVIPGIDQQYVEAGYDQGYYTLRIGEKGDKPMPESVDVIYGNNHKELTYSKPHLDLLHYMGFDEAQTVIEECRTVGETLNRVKFRTRPNNHVLDENKQGDDLNGF